MTKTTDTLQRRANFSRCRQYRYALWRQWGDGDDFMLLIGLNPSTGDHRQDNPTIRRCMGFAHDWGYSGLCVANLFAYRATYPKDLFAATDPVGPKKRPMVTPTSAAGRSCRRRLGQPRPVQRTRLAGSLAVTGNALHPHERLRGTGAPTVSSQESQTPALGGLSRLVLTFTLNPR